MEKRRDIEIMRVYIEKSVLSSIAAAIRNRSNSSEHYYPSEMPLAIRNIPRDNDSFLQEISVVRCENVPVYCAGNQEQQLVIPSLLVE